MSSRFIVSLGFIAWQTTVLLTTPPSPFDKPTNWTNVFIYGAIAYGIVAAWNNRPRKERRRDTP